MRNRQKQFTVSEEQTMAVCEICSLFRGRCLLSSRNALPPGSALRDETKQAAKETTECATPYNRPYCVATEKERWRILSSIMNHEKKIFESKISVV